MCGHTRLDRSRNEVTRKKVGVRSIKDKMRDVRLGLYGHIRKRSIDALVMRCERIVLSECRRDRGRPKKSWSKVIRHDLRTFRINGERNSR